MEHHHTISHNKNKPKTLPSAHKAMHTVIRDAEVYDTMENLKTLQKLRLALCDKPPGKETIIL
jgi:hypothetical protein